MVHRSRFLHQSIYLLLLFIVCCFDASSQSGFYVLGGATTAGFARAGTTLKGISAMYTNPAGIAESKGWAFDASVERRFGLADLQNVSMAVTKKLKLGTFGILASQFGYSEFNEQKIAFAYGRQLSKTVNIGGQFDLLSNHISTIGSTNTFTFEIGAQIKISKALTLATHIFNPTRSKLSDVSTLGTRFRIGLQYNPSDKVALIGEIDKLEYRAIDYKLAVLYRPSKMISIRIGASPTTHSYGLGLGFTFSDKYHVNTAYLTHQTLGSTPAVSLQYQEK